jgi:site-specific recombinase XerD
MPGDFLTWCDVHGVSSITAVQPLHVATWIEMQTRELSAPTVKQHLAAIRHLFDWFVTGQVVPTKPADRCAGRRTQRAQATRRCLSRLKRGC